MNGVLLQFKKVISMQVLFVIKNEPKSKEFGKNLKPPLANHRKTDKNYNCTA
jgi:hypothetical protein